MLLPIRNHIMHMGLANAASALYPFLVLLDGTHEVTDWCGSLPDAISHLKYTLTSLLSPCLTKFAPRTYRHHEHFGRYQGNCYKEGMILPMMLIYLPLYYHNGLSLILLPGVSETPRVTSLGQVMCSNNYARN